MASRYLQNIRARVDWATLIPTISPFAAYALIMALVLAFGE
jgi:hypothetical protein